MEKTYIGKVEAFEIALERGMDKLPRKGTEVITVRQKGHPLGDSVLGKDEHGYYTAENIVF